MLEKEDNINYLQSYFFLREANHIFKQIKEKVMENISKFENLYQSQLDLKEKLYNDHLKYQIEKFKDYNENLQAEIKSTDHFSKLQNIVQTNFEIIEKGRIIKEVKFGRYIYSMANAPDENKMETLKATEENQINALIESEIKKEPWKVEEEIHWEKFKNENIFEDKQKFDKLINTKYPVNDKVINKQLEILGDFNQQFSSLQIMIQSFQNLNQLFTKDIFEKFVERSQLLVEKINEYYLQQRDLLSNTAIFHGMFKSMHTLSYFTQFDLQIKQIILTKELNMKYFLEIIHEIHQKNIESNTRDQQIVTQIYNAVQEIGKQIESRLRQIKDQSFAITISMIPITESKSLKNAVISNCTGGKINIQRANIRCDMEYDNNDQIAFCENILKTFQEELDEVKKLQIENKQELDAQTQIYNRLKKEKNQIDSMENLNYLLKVKEKFQKRYEITLFTKFIIFINAFTSETNPEKIVILDLDYTLKCIQNEAQIGRQYLKNWVVDFIYSQLNQQQGNIKKTNDLLNSLFISYGSLHANLLQKFQENKQLAKKPLNSQFIAKILSKIMIQERIVLLNQDKFEIKKIKEAKIQKLITQLRMTQLCIDKKEPFLESQRLFKQEMLQLQGKIKPFVHYTIETQYWKNNENNEEPDMLPYDLSPGSNFHLLINSLKCLN